VPELLLGHRHRRVLALIRGFACARAINRQPVDLTRSTLYMLLPLSLALSVVLMGAGRDPELLALQG
jgi:K+-transporting ATPase A subunit